MIYIIEGNTGAGKTTFINTLSGFEIRKLGLSSLQEIQDTLSNVNGDVVFDRLFGLSWLNKTDDEILELNEYLKTVPNLVCYKFMVDEATSLERYIDKKKTILGREICEQEKVIFSQTVHRQYEGFIRLFKLMDVFKERKEQPK
jgi:thymidylate kinase